MTREHLDVGRSFLFVPGNRPDRFERATSSGADVVIVDLEDAVPARDKAAARDAARGWVARHEAVVRVNAGDSPWHEQDVAALRGSPGLLGVVLPKAQSGARVAQLAAALHPVPVLPLVETAAGILAAGEIATAPGVARLLFGNLDYARDVGLAPQGGGEWHLLHPRSVLAVTSAAAGLPGPVDGVHPVPSDTTGLVEVCRHVSSLGFTGKLAIHPAQVEAVNQSFTPSEDLQAWARKIVQSAEADSPGVAVVDGEMVDRPVVERAERVLERARAARSLRSPG